VESRTFTGLIGGRYRLAGLLGEGGMARVFDAFDERLERPVAVKVLRPETEALPGMRRRFQQEARIAARLVHPNIVAVLDYGDDTSFSYLVMERLPGTTLRDEIARGPLSAPRVARVLTETLAGLAAAHKMGVLHRDIKPSNLLLDESGHTKIADFGIAKSFDLGRHQNGVSDDMTLTGFVLGTPGYLAPERRAGRPATVQSDLYSVGAVMVEAVTGRRADRAALPAEALPLPLRAVAGPALATDPGGRFPSALAMLEALKSEWPGVTPRPAGTAPMPGVPVTQPVARSRAGVGTGTLLAPTAVRPVPPAARTRRRRALLAALALAALASIPFLLLRGGDRPTGPAASATSHHTVAGADQGRAAIATLAASLAAANLPGDGAMAAALHSAAAEHPGASRLAAAQAALSLAQVLLAGGGITPGQYQQIAIVLEAIGASPPTSTTTTTAAAPAPADAPHHGPHHGQGDGQGDGQG